MLDDWQIDAMEKQAVVRGHVVRNLDRLAAKAETHNEVMLLKTVGYAASLLRENIYELAGWLESLYPGEFPTHQEMMAELYEEMEEEEE